MFTLGSISAQRKAQMLIIGGESDRARKLHSCHRSRWCRSSETRCGAGRKKYLDTVSFGSVARSKNPFFHRNQDKPFL